MRKIKLRFWNKNNDTMYTVDSIDYVGDEITVNDGFLICDEQAVLMQYTGCYIDQVSYENIDPELYEGDVLIDELTAKKYVIEFSFGAFYACCINHEDNVVLSDFLGEEDVSKCGNIYENPELFK